MNIKKGKNLNRKTEKLFALIVGECAIAAVLICTLLAMQNINKTEQVAQSQTTVQQAEQEQENQQLSVEEPPFEPTVTNVEVVMVGDCLIHKPLYLGAKQDDGTYDFSHMFDNIKTDIQEADISMINQETIFINDETQYSSYPRFGSPIEVGIAEANAGFDVIAHSTNHTIDKGVQGILDTISFWKNNYPEIKYLGIHDNPEDDDIAYMNKNGIKFAFVNYTYGLNGLESLRNGKEYLIDMLIDDDIENTLRLAESNADVTIAILHVGEEYVYEPTDYAKQQVERMIDNGADIVLCAHPHVVEPYGIITTENGNKGLVYYSLGNFISAQDQLPRIVGGMAKINIQKTQYEEYDEIQITDYEMVPLVTHMEYRYYTTYKLKDYTELLSKMHYLQKDYPFTPQSLMDLYNDIVGKNNIESLIIKNTQQINSDDSAPIVNTEYKQEEKEKKEKLQQNVVQSNNIGIIVNQYQEKQDNSDTNHVTEGDNVSE